MKDDIANYNQWRRNNIESYSFVLVSIASMNLIMFVNAYNQFENVNFFLLSVSECTSIFRNFRVNEMNFNKS